MMPFGGMYQRHAMPLSLVPLIPYLQALYHSVAVVVVNTIFLLGLLHLQPIGGVLSRAVGPVYASTGDAVVPTSFLSLEGCGVGSGSTLLVE